MPGIWRGGAADALSGVERDAESRLSQNYFASVFDNGVEA